MASEFFFSARRIALTLGIGMALMFASSAFGHSSSMSSTPAPGAVLSTSPEALRVPFDGPMRVITTTLTNQAGDSFDVQAQAGRDASDTLVVMPPALPGGDYTLEWRGVSADGHTMTDSLSFRVDTD